MTVNRLLAFTAAVRRWGGTPFAERSIKLRTGVAFVLALWLAADPLPVLAVNPSYGGYQSGNNYYGIDGYIDQTVTASTDGLHAAWITVCEVNDCNHWTQMGDMQGCWSVYCEHTRVVVFYENKDACGDYNSYDYGPLPNHDEPFYLNWDLGPSYQLLCSTGIYKTAYRMQYRLGSFGSTPFYVGNLGTRGGLVLAKTELQGTAQVITDWFGCTASHSCGTAGYGMHLYNGAWSSWTSDASPSHGNPAPYLSTYHNYWAFKTCGAPC